MLRLLQGVRRLRPVVHASAPQWDLPMVLEALVTELFEPLEFSSLKALSWKTALLLALNVSQKSVRVNRSVGAPELFTDSG